MRPPCPTPHADCDRTAGLVLDIEVSVEFSYVASGREETGINEYNSIAVLPFILPSFSKLDETSSPIEYD